MSSNAALNWLIQNDPYLASNLSLAMSRQNLTGFLAGCAACLLLIAAVQPVAAEQVAAPSPSTAPSSQEVWGNIKHAIALVEGSGDKAETYREIIDALGVVQESENPIRRVPNAPPDDAMTINGYAQHIHAAVTLSYYKTNFLPLSHSPPEGPVISFRLRFANVTNAEMRSGPITGQCIEYYDIMKDLASLGWASELKRDFGVDGVNTREGTISFKERKLWGVISFYMPLETSESRPKCLEYIDITKYDAGLPAYLR